MARGLRLAGAAVIACASVPFLGAPAAHADGVTLTPSNSAYFFSKGVDKPDESPAAPPNVTGIAADGVSAGHLAVAANAGTEDKVSFLYFDVFALPAEAVIEKAVVTMKLVPASPEDISYQASPDKVQACKAGDSGFSGDDGAGLEKNAPERLCAGFSAKGTLKDPTTYQWDITGLASTWLTESNDGVAFTRADEAASSNFQVVFDAAPTAGLVLTYSVPAAETPITPTVPTSPDLGSGVPIDTSGNVPIAPAPGVVAGPSEPLLPNPAVNNPPVPAASGQQPVRAVALSTTMTPTTGFWLGGLALLAMLVLVAMVQGDNRVPAAATSRSRLTQALDARQRGTSQAFRPRPV